MNYMQVYNNLIASRKYGPSLLPYCKTNGQLGEWHHIVPKCLGGSNDKANLVFLAHKEHYVAHRLLALAMPHSPKLTYAWWAMCNKNRKTGKIQVTSAAYSQAKRLSAKASSDEWKGKCNRPAELCKGPTQAKTETHKKSLSDSLKQTFKNGHPIAGRPQTDDHKAKKAQSKKETMERLRQPRADQVAQGLSDNELSKLWGITQASVKAYCRKWDLRP